MELAIYVQGPSYGSVALLRRSGIGELNVEVDAEKGSVIAVEARFTVIHKPLIYGTVAQSAK